MRRAAHRAVIAALGALAIALLGGCAAEPPIPAGIRTPPPGNVQLAEVLRAVDRHVGARVRWGGTVVEVSREPAGAAEVQILERKLDQRGRPIPSSPSDGRFVVRAPPGMDPDLYAMGDAVTVAGRIAGRVEREVGGTKATLPVIEVADFVRWLPPPYPADWYYPPYDYPPWWHPPWYGPYPGWPQFHFGFGYRRG